MDRAAVRKKRMQKECALRLPLLDQVDVQILTTMIALWGFPQCNPLTPGPEARRFGDGNVTDTEGIDQGVANDSEASTPSLPAWDCFTMVLT